MSILNMSDYKIVLAERICIDKFDNDIMLIFSNFSDKSINLIIDMIKNDIREIEFKGVIFDYELLNIFCTMYLGLSWSMYRKGKLIQKQEKLIGDKRNNESDEKHIDGIILDLYSNINCIQIINDISTRYFTLYLDRYLMDMIRRMEITKHPEISNELELKNVIIKRLNKFAIQTLGIGIFDEYNKMNN